MKKTLTALMMVLLLAMLFISCDNNAKDPEKESEAKTYKVTFDLNGGTGDIKAQTVKDGDKAAKPAAAPSPANTNYYAFDCWTKEGETTAFDFANTSITSDTTLVAKWKNRYKVGDTGPAGGKIFYVVPDSEGTKTSTFGSDSLTWKYLEAATSNASAGADAYGTYKWSTNATVECTTGTGIGSGWSNTQEIQAKDGYSSTTFPAVYACVSYSLGGKTDWFLPSKDELNEMYENKDKIGSFVNDDYWSSSEDDSDYAWYQYFYDGSQFNDYRNDNKCVRPIRAF